MPVLLDPMPLLVMSKCADAKKVPGNVNALTNDTPPTVLNGALAIVVPLISVDMFTNHPGVIPVASNCELRVTGPVGNESPFANTVKCRVCDALD